MIFKLTTAKYFFNDEGKAKYEKMGFSFKLQKYNLKEENSEYIVDKEKLPTLIFDSIDTLKIWHETFDVYHDLIIDFDDKEITIYDDYME